MTQTGFFAVYHQAPDTYTDVYDGLFVVCADDELEARKIVEEKLGPDLNGVVVEALGSISEPKIVLEFWRQVPARPPRKVAELKQGAVA